MSENHEVKIVEIKELSDELVSYRLRCCDDQLSDSWHTVSVAIANHDASLAERKQDIAARHERKHAWREKYAAKLTPDVQP
jgi:hypothetical protein